MKTDVAHTVKFILLEDFEKDNSVSLYSVGADSAIPLPNVGEVIQYLTMMRDGKEVTRMNVDDLSPDSDITIERSKEYQVIEIRKVYHEKEIVASSSVKTSRVEVVSAVIVEEYDEIRN